MLPIERFQDYNFRLKINEQIWGYSLTLLMKDQSKMATKTWGGGRGFNALGSRVGYRVSIVDSN